MAGGLAGSQLQAIWTVEMKPHQAAKEKGQCLEKSYTLRPLKGRTVLSRRNIPLIMLSQALLWTKENVQIHRCILTCVTDTYIPRYKW